MIVHVCTCVVTSRQLPRTHSLICRIAPYLPKISYISSGEISNGRFLQVNRVSSEVEQVTFSPSKVGVRPQLPNTDQQEEYPCSQGLLSFPYMELWSYLTYSILFTSGGKRTWRRRRGKKRRRVACFILL